LESFLVAVLIFLDDPQKYNTQQPYASFSLGFIPQITNDLT